MKNSRENKKLTPSPWWLVTPPHVQKTWTLKVSLATGSLKKQEYAISIYKTYIYQTHIILRHFCCWGHTNECSPLSKVYIKLESVWRVSEVCLQTLLSKLRFIRSSGTYVPDSAITVTPTCYHFYPLGSSLKKSKLHCHIMKPVFMHLANHCIAHCLTINLIKRNYETLWVLSKIEAILSLITIIIPNYTSYEI